MSYAVLFKVKYEPIRDVKRGTVITSTSINEKSPPLPLRTYNHSHKKARDVTDTLT